MLLALWQPGFTTGNPSYLTDMEPGGADTIIAGTVTGPVIDQTIEPIIREVIDNTPTTPALQGKLLVQEFTAANADDGGLFVQNTTASQALPRFSYGIVDKSAAEGGQGGEATIICDGVAQAYCTTSGTAIAAGTLLGADGAGNLTPIASPTAGEVLAIALGALAEDTSTPTLVPVKVGGY